MMEPLPYQYWPTGVPPVYTLPETSLVTNLKISATRVDRLKRMINTSGFNAWPAEVELMMYGHRDIQEACVISAKDARRGRPLKPSLC